MKSFLIASTVVALFFGTSAFSQSSTSTPKADHPNLVRVTYPSGGAYVHPSKLADWLAAEPLDGDVVQGQVSVCAYKETIFVTSTPHVLFSEPDPPQLPGTSPWFGAMNKTSVCFTLVEDTAKAGFAQVPKQVVSIAHRKPATIRGALFSAKAMGVVAVDLVGDLLVTDKPFVDDVIKAFGSSMSEFRQRLVRTRDVPFAHMKIEPEFVPHLRGLSGSIVWQEGNPVGVFVAAVVLKDSAGSYQTHGIIESLDLALAATYVDPKDYPKEATAAAEK